MINTDRIKDGIHQQGHLSIENMPDLECLGNCDLGVRVLPDGRVWLCVNGIAFIRFKPDQNIGVTYG
jgi:hypothetical protein